MVAGTTGYPINWAISPANQAVTSHPLYIKYSSSTFANIDETQLKSDLGTVMATAGSAEICAYLSWLLRTITLISP